MIVLIADYEGLGVAIAQGFWILLTIPAALLAVGGIVAGAMNKPRTTLAVLLGAGACLVQLGGVVIVCLAFADEQARLGDYSERFRPGVVIWVISTLTIAAGLIAIFLGLSRKQQHTAE